jgi:quercetin dioxygenase-like cupin family protein
MTWKNLKDLIQYPEGGIISKKVFDREGMDVTLFSMSAGTDISDHTSTKEGIVYVIDGRGTFVLEGKSIDMSPGVIIYLDKDAVHSLKADDDFSFILALKS